MVEELLHSLYESLYRSRIGEDQCWNIICKLDLDAAPGAYPAAMSVADLAKFIYHSEEDPWEKMELLWWLVEQHDPATFDGMVHGADVVRSRLAGTVHVDAVTQADASNLIEHMKKLRYRGADQCPTHLLKFLQAKGVPCSDDSTSTHGHGALKALEMHMLLDKLAPRLAGRVTFLTQKQSKYDLLTASPSAKGLTDSNLMNWRFDVADELRYMGSDEFNYDRVFETAVACDSGHHFTKSNVMELFDHCPQLDTLHLLCIAPGETLTGHSSAHPQLYQLRYGEKPGSFTFLLEGQAEGAYTHDQLPWMLHPQVLHNDRVGHLSVQPVESVFAHTLVTIIRGKTRLPFEFRQSSSCTKQLVDESGLLGNSNGLFAGREKKLVEFDLFTKVVEFLPSLKVSNNIPALRAKIASLKLNPNYSHHSAETWMLLEEVAVQMSVVLSNRNIKNKFNSGRWDLLKMRLADWLLQDQTVSWEAALRLFAGVISLVLPFFAGLPVSLGFFVILFLISGGNISPEAGVWRHILAKFPVLNYSMVFAAKLWRWHVRWRDADQVQQTENAGLAKASEFELVFRRLDGFQEVASGDFYSHSDLKAKTVANVNCSPASFTEISTPNEAAALTLIPAPVEPEPLRPFASDAVEVPLPSDEDFDGSDVENDSVASLPEPTGDRATALAVAHPALERASGKKVKVQEAQVSRDVRDIGDAVDLPAAPASVLARRARKNVQKPSLKEKKIRAKLDRQFAENNKLRANTSLETNRFFPLGSPSELDELTSSFNYSSDDETDVPLKETSDTLNSGKKIRATTMLHVDDTSFLHSRHKLFEMLPGSADLSLEYQEMCAIEAVAKGWRCSPLLLFSTLRSAISGAQLRDWRDNGSTEVIFAVLGWLFKKQIALKNCGLKSLEDKVSKFVILGHRKPVSDYSPIVIEFQGPEHWELLQHGVKRSGEKRLTVLPSQSKKCLNKGQEFMRDLRAHKDTHGMSPILSSQKYEATWARAKVVLEELAEGICGTMKKLEGKEYAIGFTDTMKERAKAVKSRTVNLHFGAGYGGCSKSSPIQSFLSSKGGSYAKAGYWRFGSPRVILRDDWKRKIGIDEGWFFKTFEKLFGGTAAVLIVDEISLWPPGWIDALILLGFEEDIIVLGDPNQCDYSNPDERSTLRDLTPEASWLAAHCPGTPYLAYTHRNPIMLERAFGVPTSSPVQGSAFFSNTASKKVPMFVAAEVTKRNKLMMGYKAFTISGYQGQEAEHIIVWVDNTMLTAVGIKDKHTAMCRTKNRIQFVLANGVTEEQVKNDPVFGRVWRASNDPLFRSDFFRLNIYPENSKGFVYVDKVEEMHRIRSSRALVEADVLTPGKSRAQKMMGPNLLAIHGNREFEDSGEPEEETLKMSLNPVGASSHITMTTQTIDAQIIPEMKDKYIREFITSFGNSELYPEDVVDLLVASMFPAQKRQDNVLAKKTIEKRLNRSTEARNVEDYAKNKEFGSDLWIYLASALDLPPPVDLSEIVYRKYAVEQAECRVAGKAQGLVDNLEDRASGLDEINAVRHWIKNQFKRKMEALGLSAPKAGQTLATCHETIVALIGPWVRAFIDRFKDVLSITRPKIYINHGKSAVHLDNHLKANWSQHANHTKGMANDMSDFDSTQCGESLEIDVNALRWVGAPTDVINLYIWWKTHILSDKISIKTISRDTGEPGTFAFNTLYSMCICTAKYGPEALALHTWLFGGDDTACDFPVQPTSLWRRYFSKHVRTVSKTVISLVVDFCGWICDRSGAIRNPQLMYLKARHIEAVGGNLGDAILSYTAELQFTFDKCFTLADGVLNELDFACLNWMSQKLHELDPVAATILFGTQGDTLSNLRKRLAVTTNWTTRKGRNIHKRFQAVYDKLTRGFSIKAKTVVHNNSPPRHFVMSVQHVSEVGASNADLNTQNSLAPLVGLIGSSWDQNRLRKQIVLDLHGPAATALSPGVLAWPNWLDGSYTFHDKDWFLRFAAAAPVVRLESLSVQVLPTVVALGNSLEVCTTLCGEDVAITGPNSCGETPYSEYVQLTAGEYAAMPSYQRDILAGQYGVQKQIQPKPLLGSRPAFKYAIHMCGAGQDQIDNTAATIVARLVLTVIIVRSNL